ncbi:rRNA maturation RNase YbeY [Candidatus Parcubacteria bacterium]|nr:rRNA maturation RNase YbeY [Candidatus Parcubacteria bacterium]
MSETFSLTNTTKGKLPSLPFADMKDTVLGEKYDLSLAFVTPEESQEFNKRYRQKDKPTNVLSFELTPNSGEIVICPDHAGEHSLGSLFIHGLMHLKGFEHGSTMENEERKIRERFGI